VGGVLKWKLGFGAEEKRSSSDATSSDTTLPTVVPPDLEAIHNPAPDAIQVTWIGHASFLIQCGDVSILIDPVFATHCSPLPVPSLRRRQAPGISWHDLPPIDVVLITHNHYDHLDAAVVKKLAPSTHFIVPEGLDSWMQKKGVEQTSAMPWWKQISVASGIQITCCPAQHASARTPMNRDQSHWCGWLIEWRGRKIYHSGDTGYCPHFKEIGNRFGPIDLAMLPIGAYSPRWLMEPMHVTPEEAVQIHGDIKSKQSIACHWGTFRLTDEPVMEPLQRLEAATQKQGLPEGAFTHLPIGGSVRL
jgi:N-acyl-phosphatidylethanolamine-hydrolysing phospholipase D